MYASLRHYRIEPKNMDELIRRVPGAMEVISKLDGFKAYYVVKAGDDTLATVSVFADKAGAVRCLSMVLMRAVCRSGVAGVEIKAGDFNS